MEKRYNYQTFFYGITEKKAADKPDKSSLTIIILALF